ncbi:MAG TPA: pitrilysin family protein [Allosphingosinicella sp.]|nr:pitrilysin family protein [Allosphingosinicella sp.]
MLRFFLLWLALAVLPPANAAQAPEPSAAAKTAWGFDRSDLTPHPEVRFGVLGNGMRYAVMQSAVPAGGISVRLRLDGGSSVEGDRELGFMHLVEHMIFHGSANLPEGALPLMLRHQGLRRWSDFNAFTSFDETVYRLDLAKSDGRARETAMVLMREIASNLRFNRTAVEGAKKNVREEIRGRNAVEDRLAAAQNAFFAPGTPIARGPVAGTEGSVRRANGEALRRLYERYYTPRRATLVVVGDFDPAAVEAEIQARFSDWRTGEHPEPKRRVPFLRSDRGTQAHLFVDPAAPTIVTITTVSPLASSGDASTGRDSYFLEHLGSEMLNRRLARIASRPDAPFSSADSAVYDHFATARLARIEVSAKERDWRSALRGGATELRRALDHGFSQAELDEQLAASLAALAKDAAPQSSSALADAIVDAVARGIVFTAPADGSSTAAYLARVRLDQVNAAFRAAWSSPNRLIFASHDRPIAKGDRQLLEAWTTAATD